MKYAECIHVISSILASNATHFERSNPTAEQSGFDGATDYWFRQCNMKVRGYRNANFNIRAAQLGCETTAPTTDWTVAKLKETEKDLVVCEDVAEAMKVSGLDAGLLPIVNMLQGHVILSSRPSSNGGRESKMVIAASASEITRCVAFFIEVENMVVIFQIMP